MEYLDGQEDAAERLLTAGLEGPPSAEVLAMLGAIHSKKGNFVQAVNYLDASLGLDPGQVKLWLLLADAHKARKNPDLETVALEKARDGLTTLEQVLIATAAA